jgi:DNA-directed RNA polymerase subunit L
MYVNYKNKTNSIVVVTTNDAQFYYGEKKIESPYPVDIPIIKLQKNQEIIFSAITQLGIEKQNIIYNAAGVVTYREIDDNEFDFIIESRGQISEYRIIIVALHNIIKHIDSFLNTLKIKIEMLKGGSPENNEELILSKENESYEEEDGDVIIGQLVINEEDHTLGNLITRGIQSHKAVLFAGYKMNHPLGQTITISYKIKKKVGLLKVIEDVIKYYNKLISSIITGIEKFV